MIVAADVETGGLQPYYHEAIGICLLPLNPDFSVNEKIPAFETDVKPDFPDRLDPRALKVNGKTKEELEQAPTRAETIAAFIKWHKDYVIPSGRKTMDVIAQNWSFDKPMLMAWLDRDNKQPNCISTFFHYQVRDVARIALYLCDRAQRNEMTLPFGGISLGKICQGLGIEIKDAHTARGDCLMTAAAYKKLVEL